MHRKTFIKVLGAAFIGLWHSASFARSFLGPPTLEEVKGKIYAALVTGNIGGRRGQGGRFDVKKFRWDADLVKELGFDSLDTLEYIMDVERLFDITLKDEDAEKVRTPIDVAQLAYEALQKKK